MSADFAHPEWVGPLCGVVAFAGLLLIAARRRGWRRARDLLGSEEPARVRAGDGVSWLALVAIACALAAPVIGKRAVVVPASGVDVVLLMDVSRSMDADDVPPTRLDRARQAADRVLAGLVPGDRAALAAFAGRGVLLTPLTHDRAALREMLSALDSDLVRPRGSQISQGMRAALDAFDDDQRPRLVLLLSDGEDAQRAGDLAAADAVSRDVRVIAGAFGSEEGAALRDHGVAIRDARGVPVQSRRRVRRLQVLAAATGGDLVLADAWGEIDASLLLTLLRRDAGQGPGTSVTRQVRAARVLPFAALAFLLLALPAGWTRRRAHAGTVLAGAAALILVAAGPGPTATDAATLLRRGLGLAEAGRPEEAMRALEAAAISARDPGLAALAYYDLGVLALEAELHERARDAFLDALALDPGDSRARFNLEFTLRVLDLDSEPPAAAGGEAGQPEQPDAPRPEPETQQAKAPEVSRPAPPTPDTPPAGERPAPAELGPGEAARWLSRLEDDPARALREAARDGDRRSRDAGQTW